MKNRNKLLFWACESTYNNDGFSGVINLIERLKSNKSRLVKDVTYQSCQACDNEVPNLDHTCLVCGQPTK